MIMWSEKYKERRSWSQFSELIKYEGSVKEKASNRLSYYVIIEGYNPKCCVLSPDIAGQNIKKRTFTSLDSSAHETGSLKESCTSASEYSWLEDLPFNTKFFSCHWKEK